MSNHTEADCTHVIVLRACDMDTDGPHAQVKVGHVGEPDFETLDRYSTAVQEMYEASFGRKPDRVGTAVLPWVADEDGHTDSDEETDE